MTRLDTDLPSAGPQGQGHSININVSSSERILTLDAHDQLLGLGVVADQLLVQPHGQGQDVVKGAEGDAGDQGAEGGSGGRCSCLSCNPRRISLLLTAGAEEGRLLSYEDGYDS